MKPKYRPSPFDARTVWIAEYPGGYLVAKKRVQLRGWPKGMFRPVRLVPLRKVKAFWPPGPREVTRPMPGRRFLPK